MFKKFVSILFGVMVMMSISVNSFAICSSESDRPTIIGIDNAELVEKIKSIDESGRYDEIEYQICIQTIDGIWIVGLDSSEYEGEYYAVGIYDHMPTEEEIKVLWANRMTCDELGELMDEYGL